MLLFFILFLQSCVFAADYTVLIDAGHGGRDPGAIGIKGYKEKDICLMFAKDLVTALAQYPNIGIITTRNKDMFLSLKDRLSLAQRSDVDLFLSVHMDKGNKSGYRGMSIYTQSKSSAKNTMHLLANNTKNTNLAAKQSPYASYLLPMIVQSSLDESMRLAQSLLQALHSSGFVLHNIKPIPRELYLFHQHAPNILLELGYISNHDDVRVVLDTKQRKNVAELMAKTIYEYLSSMNT